MASYLITGCSRGLGLAMAEHLMTLPSCEVDRVFATARKQSPDLKALIESSAGRFQFVELDTTDEQSIKAAVAEVEFSLDGAGLDVLINNAGKMLTTPEGIITMDDLNSHLTTNVLSVHHVTRKFLPLLQKGTLKKVANISTEMGSISRAFHYRNMPVPAYKVSKAALNALTVQYSLAFADQGFTFLAITPGWVKTDMGGEHADLTTEESAKATVEGIRGARSEMNGKFLNIWVEGWEKRSRINRYDGGISAW